MGKATLTTKQVNNLICPSDKKKVCIYDQGCRGLMLEVRSAGGKTYYFCYKDEYGKDKMFKIANTKDLSLSQARQMADHYRAKIAMEKNPKEEKVFCTKFQPLKNLHENDISHLRNPINVHGEVMKVVSKTIFYQHLVKKDCTISSKKI